ncbi:MAG: T9SS type A sorting domain-containing protein [Ignavibacteria bacterium]|nr:T9SS type A sorting domain-containing protein [Ignavibacteria bacterium]
MKTISYVIFFLFIITSTILSQGMPEVIWSIQGNSSSINAVSVSADGNKILSSDYNTVKAWDRLTHSLLNTYEDQSNTLISSTISSDGNLFTAGYVVGVYPNPNLGESSVLDINTNNVLYTVPGCFTTFTEDNSIIAAAGGGVYRDVNAHLTANGSQLFSIYTGNYNNDIAVSPSGNLIAVATSANVIKIYNSQSGTLVQTLTGHTNDVRTVAFSPDGSLIASGAGGWDTSGESSIKIWDAASGNLIVTLEGHGYWVDCLAFSFDGSYLISSGRDGLYPNINPKIILWNTSDWSLNRFYDEGLANSVRSLFAVPYTNQFVFGNTLGELTLAQLPAVIPVELTSFTADANGNDVILSWQTATETNNSGFDILREVYPANGRAQNNNWNKIGFIEGHGTTTQENNYSYADKNLGPGRYSYRLVQIDFDGTRTESEEVNVEIENQLTEYSLMQNYPNPFNPSTIIQFSIPESGNIKLEVYNSLGSEVASLLNDYQEAGNYKITFDASDLSSGIYYYRLTSNGFNEIKKMILLK